MTYHDVELTPEETERVTKYAKTFGDTWAERSLDYVRANKYLDLMCDSTAESWKAGNCFHKGSIVYKRKDGEPISIQDFTALQVMDHGQCNKRTISDDSMTMTHYWECDSGD